MQQSTAVLPLQNLCMELNTETDITLESVTELSLVGTWFMDELRLAVEKCYRVIEVMEVYEYQVT
jgi:hypothetical protein